jgi:predicted nucleic-acid-binding Zn-ribbon protein
MTNYDEKPKRTPESAARHAPCPLCGAQDYEWGHPGSQGGVYYVPEGVMFGLGQGEALALRKCIKCGNVQIFIK